VNRNQLQRIGAERPKFCEIYCDADRRYRLNPEPLVFRWRTTDPLFRRDRPSGSGARCQRWLRSALEIRIQGASSRLSWRMFLIPPGRLVRRHESPLRGSVRSHGESNSLRPGWRSAAWRTLVTQWDTTRGTVTVASCKIRHFSSTQHFRSPVNCGGFWVKLL